MKPINDMDGIIIATQEICNQNKSPNAKPTFYLPFIGLTVNFYSYTVTNKFGKIMSLEKSAKNIRTERVRPSSTEKCSGVAQFALDL